MSALRDLAIKGLSQGHRANLVTHTLEKSEK